MTEPPMDPELLLKAFALCPHAMVLATSGEARVVEANEAFLRHYGRAREDVIGRTVQELRLWADPAQGQALAAELYRMGRVQGREIVLRRATGEHLTGLWSARLIRARGRDYVLAVAEDITGRKRAEEALRGRGAFLDALLDAIPAPVFYKDREGRYLGVNRAWEEFFGSPRQEVAGKTAFDICPRELACVYQAKDEELFRSGGVQEYESQVRDVRGEVHEVVFQKRLFDRGEGSAPGLIGAILDITGRKRAEQALRESEERFRALVEQAPEGIFVQVKGLFVYINPAMLGMLGARHPGDLLGTAFIERAAPEYHELIRERIRRQQETGKSAPPMDMEYLRLDGTRVSVETTAMPIRYEGEPAHLVFVRDVTERRRAERERRENHERMDLAIGSAQLGVWEYDVRSDRRRFDDATCRMFGIDPKGFQGGTEEFLARVHPEDLPRVKAALARTIADGVPYDAEYRVVRPDGAVRDLDSHGRLLSDGSGRPEKIVGVVRDVTERKRLEAELLKVQTMDSVSVLAGGIAHDFNNLLMGILGNLSLARSGLGGPEQLDELLAEAEAAARRTQGLTQQLMTFAKGSKPVKQPLDPGRMAWESAVFAARGSNCRVQSACVEDLSVEGDEGQLRQVIHNLVLNAVQAMPEGGVVTVSCRVEEHGGSLGLPLPAGRYVVLGVKDTGAGIPEKHLGRVFDPFFTTKEHGRGLGLSMVYSVVRRHGGHVSVESRVGIGTEFRVYLPMSGRARPKTEGQAEIIRKGSGRVLVMDDDETVRRTLTAMLKSLGYEPSTTTEGASAVREYERAKEQGRPYDAVIMDLTVPGGMGGKEATKRLLEAHPEARVVASSGYSTDSVLAEHLSHGFLAVLAKPYRVEDLSRVLGSVLSPDPPTRKPG